MAVAARYVNRELISIFVVVTVVLLGVALGGQFIGYLQDAALGKYAAESLLTIVGLRLTEFLQQLLPFAFYLALVLTVGRLHAEQEMAVLQGGGVGPSRLLLWLAPLAVALAVVVGYLSLTLTPANNAELEDFLSVQRAGREFDAVSPGIFRTFQRGTRVSYAETVSEDRRELGQVFIAERRANQADVNLWSDTGTQYVDPATGSRFLLLRNGIRYEGRIGDANYRVIEFGALGQRLTVQDPAARGPRVEALPTAALIRDPLAVNVAELQWRYALPMLTLVAPVLGLGVARVKPRQGRFAPIVPGIMLFVGYYLLLLMTQNALHGGSWPLILGMWPVHGLFICVAAFLFRTVARPARA